jgi:hypothetical protein
LVKDKVRHGFALLHDFLHVLEGADYFLLLIFSKIPSALNADVGHIVVSIISHYCVEVVLSVQGIIMIRLHAEGKHTRPKLRDKIVFRCQFYLFEVEVSSSPIDALKKFNAVQFYNLQGKHFWKHVDHLVSCDK